MTILTKISSLILGTALMSIMYIQPSEAPVLAEIKETQINPLDLYIEKLSYCESRDKETALNKHDNGSPSYGRFQFKETTWNYYIDKYGLFPETEKVERMNLIWDGYAQEIVTRRILEEDKAWQNWFNCSKLIGLDKYYENISRNANF